MWRTVLGSICAVVVVLALTTNAAFMLISRRAWFGLPDWIRANETLTERRYGSGWGAVQVRLLEGIILAVIAWVAHHALSK
jgi:hypothetical protein